MKNFKTYLTEKRRNPEMNPRIFAYDVLKQYSDRSDIYISFTDLKKIGIKPLSDFNTPNGIYTYPLKEIWSDIAQYRNMEKIPYAGDRKYIFILKQKPSSGMFIEDLYKDYTSKDYDRDMPKLKKIYDEYYSSNAKKKLQDEFNIINDFIMIGFDDEMKSLQDEYTGGKISPPEFFERQKVLNIKLEKFSAKRQNVKLKLDKFKNSGPFEEFIEAAHLAARQKSPAGIFWNITRELSNEIKTLGMNDTQRWNNLLRKLGYDGFGDKQGKGIIHPAEPIQAFFLHKKAFEVIEMIENKSDSINIIKSFNDTVELLKKDKINFKTFLKILNSNSLKVEDWETETSYQIRFNTKRFKISLNDMKVIAEKLKSGGTIGSYNFNISPIIPLFLNQHGTKGLQFLGHTEKGRSIIKFMRADYKVFLNYQLENIKDPKIRKEIEDMI